MESAPAPVSTGNLHEHPLSIFPRGLAVASLSVSMFATAVLWWFPFGMFLSVVGFTLGVVGFLLGARTGPRGLFFALGGVILASTAFSVAAILRWGQSNLAM